MSVIQPQKTCPANPQAAERARYRLRFGVLPAAVCTSLLAWLSQGVIAYGDGGGSRLALLPLTASGLLLAAAAGLGVAGLLRLGASRQPLVLLLLIVLPWLPFAVPPVFLLWSGPVVVGLWVAVGGALAATAKVPRSILPAHPGFLHAGALALAIYAAAGWGVSSSRPGGDEPHYLIIAQSLLLDGDLRIENNHARGDYRPYFTGDLSKPDYLRRGRDGAIYSIHAPGLPALVAPAFAVAGYPGVLCVLLLVSATAAGLAWELARRVTGRTGAAWFGWAAVVCSPTLLLNAFTVYPDGPGGLLVLTGVWALMRAREEQVNGAESARPWLLHGAALALLPWLHTRFALLAGCIGALVLLQLARTRNPAAKASAFLAVPGLSALGWIAFFVVIYGAPDPSIPYRGSDLGSPAYIAGGLAGLLFDQMYGLFSNAPVLLAVPIGLLVLAVRPGTYRLLAAELALVAVPYLLTVTHFAMWWGGFSSPARFLVPLLPACAVPAAVAWGAVRAPSLRVVLSGALVLTASLSTALVVVDRGRLAYFDRGSVYALWMEWASRTTDLAHAFPAFFARVQRQQPGALFFGEIAVWIAAVALACVVLRAADGRWRGTRGAVAARTGVVLALAGMAAISIVWRLERVDGRTPARAAMTLLRRVGHVERAVSLDLTGGRLLSSSELVQRMDLRLARAPRAGGAPREDRALFTLPQVPAGEYRLRVERGGGSGWLMAGAGIGRDQFALVTERVERFDREVSLRFPVDLRALVVRGDEDAGAHVAELLVRPVSIGSRSQKASAGMARRAVRYGDATAFFMDDRSFPEPSGFWVGGARHSGVVLQPDDEGRSMALSVRNAPVDNVVRIRIAAWTDTLRLSRGEERRIELPTGGSRSLWGARLVEFDVTSGFQPSHHDPASSDTRFLGVWVRVD